MKDLELIQTGLNTFVPTFLVLAGIWFAAFRVWPWYTMDYVPKRREMDERLAQINLQLARSIEENTEALASLCTCLSEFAQIVDNIALRRAQTADPHSDNGDIQKTFS